MISEKKEKKIMRIYLLKCNIIPKNIRNNQFTYKLIIIIIIIIMK